MIETALIRAVTDRLGLEMRSGKLLTGSDRIAEHARGGMVTWLAHAADAAPDGSRKLDQAWRVGREAEGSGLTGVTLPLDRAALSVALGRENVVHLALTESSAAKRLDVPLSRLLHFLSRPDDVGPPDVPVASRVRPATAIRVIRMPGRVTPARLTNRDCPGLLVTKKKVMRRVKPSVRP
jgi:hypothetical protein